MQLILIKKELVWGVVGHTHGIEAFSGSLLHIFFKGAEGMAAGHGVGVHIKTDFHGYSFLCA